MPRPTTRSRAALGGDEVEEEPEGGENSDGAGGGLYPPEEGAQSRPLGEANHHHPPDLSTEGLTPLRGSLAPLSTSTPAVGPVAATQGVDGPRPNGPPQDGPPPTW